MILFLQHPNIKLMYGMVSKMFKEGSVKEKLGKLSDINFTGEQ